MDVCELFLNVICEFYEDDSRARTFGTGTELYHSEIHMLQCIAENPELHISGFARLLGVTRGAASQTAKRLVRKGMVAKEPSPEDEKKILLRLTPQGKRAAANHKCAHDRYHEVISGILNGADREQLRFLEKFLLSFETAIRDQAEEDE